MWSVSQKGINPGMIDQIVQTSQLAMLVGGGPVALRDLRALCARAGAVVGVDGGANRLAAAGIVPDAVLGDLDSLDESTRAALPSGRLHRIAEQDTTDFEKALMRVSAPVILGLGFLGARRDHELANYNALLRFAHRRCVLVGRDEVVMLAPPALRLDCAAGTRVSLVPLVPVTGQSRGLEWPIDGIAFAPGGRMGTSNRATGAVDLRMDGPGMLLILPRSELGRLQRALLAQPGEWPVRA